MDIPNLLPDTRLFPLFAISIFYILYFYISIFIICYITLFILGYPWFERAPLDQEIKYSWRCFSMGLIL